LPSLLPCYGPLMVATCALRKSAGKSMLTPAGCDMHGALLHGLWSMSKNSELHDEILELDGARLLAQLVSQQMVSRIGTYTIYDLHIRYIRIPAALRAVISAVHPGAIQAPSHGESAGFRAATAPLKGTTKLCALLLR